MDHTGNTRALPPGWLAHTSQVSPLSRLAFRASRPQTRGAPRHPFRSHLRVPDEPTAQASPSSRWLAATRRRIGFVILRAARSPPAAPHPASRRRSCLRLHVSWQITRVGLAPPWQNRHHSRTRCRSAASHPTFRRRPL